MPDKRCFICKYMGASKTQSLFSSNIYKKNGEAFEVNLCYMHSIEYFKTGQVKFFSNYENIFKGYAASDEDQKIINILDELKRA